MSNLRTARLARWQQWLLGLSLGLLWLSGVMWLLLHHHGQIQGEFGPETNPLESWTLRLHGLMLIPALLGIGGLFLAHIPKGWHYRHQRVAGIVLGLALGVLILSGYLLYYVGDEALRAKISLVHWIIGVAGLAPFVWHWLNGRRLR